MDFANLLKLLLSFQNKGKKPGNKATAHRGGIFAIPKAIWRGRSTPASGSRRARIQRLYWDTVLHGGARGPATSKQAGFGRKWCYR